MIKAGRKKGESISSENENIMKNISEKAAAK